MLLGLKDDINYFLYHVFHEFVYPYVGKTFSIPSKKFGWMCDRIKLVLLPFKRVAYWSVGRESTCTLDATVLGLKVEQMLLLDMFLLLGHVAGKVPAEVHGLWRR